MPVPGDWWDRFWDGLGARWRRFFVAIGVIAALCLCGAIAWGVYSPHVPRFKNPNFVDAILENRLVMAAVRVGIIGVVLYIVVSVFGHVLARRWLTAAGPLKVSDPVQVVTQIADARGEDLEKAEATVDDLTRQLKAATDALGVAVRDRDEAYQMISQQRKSPGNRRV